MISDLFIAYCFIISSDCGSGGPLLDSKGNLIGINTAIFTQTGNIPIFYFANPLHFIVLNGSQETPETPLNLIATN